MRISIAAMLIVGTALTAGAYLLVVQHEASLTAGVHNAARLRAHVVASAFTRTGLKDNITVGGDDNLYQLLDTSRAIVASSPNIAGRDAVSNLQPTERRAVGQTLTDAHVGDSSFYIVARVISIDQHRYTLYVGTALESVDAGIANLKGLLVLGLPTLVLLVGATTWLLTGRALRPVEAIRTEVEAITADELNRRVPEPNTADEIARLAHTMNRMLARLEHTRAREQQFVADASHELRSPLASIRAQLEVNVEYPELAARQASDREILVDTIRLQRLVDDLLTVSKLEGTEHADRQWALVDVDAIVLREARWLRTRTSLHVDTSGVSGSQVLGNADEITQAVKNLLDNGARHAHSTIVAELSEDDRYVHLTIADDGPGIPRDAQRRIFERFVRLDESRARDTGGTGLGLAITHAIVSAHGGSITVSGPPGARFVVTLPASTTPMSSPSHKPAQYQPKGHRKDISAHTTDGTFPSSAQITEASSARQPSPSTSEGAKVTRP
jgi:signal transduction histidine kinase